MELIDKNIAGQTAADNGTTITKLGLRFDKVVIELLTNLRADVSSNVPDGMAVLLTVTAPIKLPSKTELEISRLIKAILHAEIRNKETFVIFQNEIRIRVIEVPATQAEKFIGFVHNPNCDATQLLDLATKWLFNSD